MRFLEFNSSIRKSIYSAMGGFTLVSSGQNNPALAVDLPRELRNAENGATILSLQTTLPSGEGEYRLDFPIQTVLTCRTWLNGPIRNPIGIPNDDNLTRIGRWFQCDSSSSTLYASEWRFSVTAKWVTENTSAGRVWLWRGLLQSRRNGVLEPALALESPPESSHGTVVLP